MMRRRGGFHPGFTVLAALSLVVATLVASCKRSDEPTQGSQLNLVAPITAPSTLVMQGVVASPQEFWTRLRSGLGQQGRRLPKHYPLLLTELLGASPVLTGRFQVNAPVRGAVAVQGQRVDWVMGVAVRSGSELVAELSTGAQAAYRAERKERLVLLSRPGTEEFPARGVSGNHLLLASSRDALELLGAYVGHARIEESTKAPTGTLVLDAVDGSGKRLAKFWRTWWKNTGGDVQKVWAAQALDAPFAGLAPQLSAWAEEAAQGLALLLDSTQASTLSLSIEGARLELSGEHEGRVPWSVAKNACNVVAAAPFQQTSVALSWGTAGAVLLRPSAASNDDGARPRSAEARPAGDLQLMGPALLGIAEPGALTAFADVALGAGVEETALSSWLSSWLSPARGTDSLQVRRQPGRNMKLWRITTPKEAPTPAQFEVAVAERADRAHWLIGEGTATRMGQWGQGQTALPWGPDCSRLLFGGSVGLGEAQLALWITDRGEGIRLRAHAPLRAMFPQ